jgi:hypothetical protein
MIEDVFSGAAKVTIADIQRWADDILATNGLVRERRRRRLRPRSFMAGLPQGRVSRPIG